MPRIITSCPTTGAHVPTGHRSQDFELGAIVEPRSFRCPVCHQVHSWRGDAAWVEHANPRPAVSEAASSS